MDYKKLYKLARVNVRICTALEKVDCDSRKLSPRLQHLSRLAKNMQDSLTQTEKQEAVRLIGNLNGLRLECKRKFWKE